MSRGRAVMLLASVVLGCTGPAPAPTTPPTTAGPSPSTATSSTTAPAPVLTRDEPPTASLAAEGGDPVVGQLGTYIWRDGGSDSPWLRGAPISVGAGEPLTMTLEPAVGISTWTARSVPASADGPAGATILARGTGTPAFPAPAPGAWTVELRVVFGDAVGSASYAWRLEVS